MVSSPLEKGHKQAIQKRHRVPVPTCPQFWQLLAPWCFQTWLAAPFPSASTLTFVAAVTTDGSGGKKLTWLWKMTRARLLHGPRPLQCKKKSNQIKSNEQG
jgi:hypothetical protein